MRLPVYRLQLIRDFSLPIPNQALQAPAQVAELLHPFVVGAPQEHLLVLAVNAKHRPIGLHVAAVGQHNAVHVDIASIFRFAIATNAHAIFVGHNHPSGDPTPSPADRTLTQRLADAGTLLGIPVLDDLVLGDTTWVSLTYPPDSGRFAVESETSPAASAL